MPKRNSRKRTSLQTRSEQEGAQTKGTSMKQGGTEEERNESEAKITDQGERERGPILQKDPKKPITSGKRVKAGTSGRVGGEGIHRMGKKDERKRRLEDDVGQRVARAPSREGGNSNPQNSGGIQK